MVAVDDVAYGEGAPHPDNLLSQEARMKRWQAHRRPIDHLQPGVVTDADGARLPLFDVGSKIAVECRTDVLQDHPWLETLVGRVRSIDDESGVVTLFDDDSDPRLPAVRYVSFLLPDLFDIRLVAVNKRGQWVNPFKRPDGRKKRQQTLSV